MIPRLTIFDERDDCLLVYLPAGHSVRLPVLTSPLRKIDIIRALEQEGVEARVTVEPRTGRWSETLLCRMKDERCEKAQRQMAPAKVKR